LNFRVSEMRPGHLFQCITPIGITVSEYLGHSMRAINHRENCKIQAE
jgi:hypothetical protein